LDATEPKWLDERQAPRFMWRASTLVAVERIPGSRLSWLADLEVRRQFWIDEVEGHLDDAADNCTPPNAAGVTYRASTWIDGGKRRLLLLSEMC
jgi:hypothetical protein